MLRKYFIIVIILLFTPVLSLGQGLKYNSQVYDFGHIGIEFKVFCTYMLINETDQTITITDMDVSCDCTMVNPSDTTMNPGDTVYLDMTFETKDYFGPVNKSFTVLTDYKERPEIQFFYLAIVGQWFNGIKPDPISLFFLPGKKSQTVRIPNKVFDNISVDYQIKYNDYFIAKTLKDNAEKNEFLEIELSPSPSLPVGTNHSSLTIGVSNSDSEEKTILTIPVKLVKY